MTWEMVPISCLLKMILTFLLPFEKGARTFPKFLLELSADFSKILCWIVHPPPGLFPNFVWNVHPPSGLFPNFVWNVHPPTFSTKFFWKNFQIFFKFFFIFSHFLGECLEEEILNGFLGYYLEEERLEGKMLNGFWGKCLEGECAEGKIFHWFLGKGLEGEGVWGKIFHWLLGTGLFGENMLNGFWENDILQLHIHPPSPLRGRGALRRDEATKSSAARCFLSTSFLPGGIGF